MAALAQSGKIGVGETLCLVCVLPEMVQEKSLADTVVPFGAYVEEAIT